MQVLACYETARLLLGYDLLAIGLEGSTRDVKASSAPEGLNLQDPLHSRVLMTLKRSLISFGIYTTLHAPGVV